MKFIISTILFLMTSSPIYSDNLAGSLLDPYQLYLEAGTYDGQDWRSFSVLPKSRYDTFKYAFNHFEDTNGKVVVELGTSRSFTHGGLPGCNLNDPKYWTIDQPENWDWGAGFFTRMCAICLDHLDAEIHTVDIVASHIQRCKVMTKDYSHLMTYHVASSLDYLKQCNFPNGIDIIYLDTGDMTPIEPTAELQLQEAKIIVERDLLSDTGIILIDDVKNQTPKKFGEESDLGKSKYSLPYLLDNGYEIVMDEYQVILRKKQT